MGSWNKTCGLTNLPIMYGEKTYVFVIEQVQELTNHCGSTHLYRPLLLPFTSTYDDYGNGSNSHGIALPLILDRIKQCLVEMPLGENKYREIAVTKEDWGIDLFFKAIQENRLLIKNYNNQTQVSFVMMRKDVVDELIETYEFEEFVGSGNGTHGYENSYIKYRFSDVINDIDPLFENIIQNDKLDRFNLSMDMIISRQLVGDIPKNYVVQWARQDASSAYSGIVRSWEHIIDLVLNKDLAHELMIDYLKGLFVDKFMTMTRKSWIPCGHEGSQDQDHTPYRALISAMINVMDDQDADLD